MITVGEMIECLSKLDKDKPFVIRKSEGDGYYSDWNVTLPQVLYPGGTVNIMAFEPFGNELNEACKDIN